jgi:CRISPR/Cas system CSM-associated protein Csm3 (group 7 of RAMP superfamily)
MLEIRVTLTFETPPNIGSGAQVSTLADRAFIKERDGWPYVPASTFKGRLRHAVEQVAQGLGQQVCRTHHKMCRDKTAPCPVCAIFGSPWIPGRLCFVDLKLSGPQELVKQRGQDKVHPRTDWRYGVALSRRRGVAEDALLYTTELFVPGVPISFSGALTGPLGEREAAWLVAGLRLLPALGRSKSTGLGWLTAQAEVTIDGQQLDKERLHAALQEVIS